MEREKAKKAAEAKAKAEAQDRANHLSRTQRREAHIAEKKRQQQEEDSDESDEESEDEAARRAQLRKTEKESDLKHAEDLFGNLGISKNRSAGKPVAVADPKDPANRIDLSTLPIFNPQTKDQFLGLRETLGPLLEANSGKAHYGIFLQEFVKQVAKDLPSEQIKKIASTLTALSNEKMKEEKAAERGGKKSKAAKTKVTLAASRNISQKADTTSYDDGLDE